MKRIAVFAGAFDPIHHGHLCVLRAVLSTCGADKIILLPSNTPPYRKPAVPVKELRDMCRLAISCEVDIVLADEKPLNSDQNIIHAIQDIKKAYGKAKYVYIVGADKLAGLLHWSKMDRLSHLCSFLVYPRTGYHAEEIVRFAVGKGLKAELLEMPVVTITSAAIRNHFFNLEHVTGLLDRQVERIIVKNGFYQTDFIKSVRPHINRQRFEHTLGVMELAVDLAFEHHAWMQGAAVASLFHDCAKEMKLSKMHALLHNYGENFTDQESSSTALLHGKVAALIAKHAYGIDHQDILNAIVYHTTGRSYMSKLELSVFVADKAEPGRKYYPGLRDIRKLMHTDLAGAALLSMKGTQTWIKESGFHASPDADAAIRAMERRCINI